MALSESAILNALIDNRGIISLAASELGCKISTIYERLYRSPKLLLEYRTSINTIREKCLSDSMNRICEEFKSKQKVNTKMLELIFNFVERENLRIDRYEEKIREKSIESTKKNITINYTIVTDKRETNDDCAELY